MKRIWSPWRMKYIQNEKSTEDCPFCAALGNPESADHFILHKREKAFVILNRYPYTTGHLLILPVEHKDNMADLDSGTRGEIMELINHALIVLDQIYHPEGYNVGLNMGEAAGAGIPKHLHWHIVPRWVGDTNYMTSVGEVRVLPETLEDTYKKIISAW